MARFSGISKQELYSWEFKRVLSSRRSHSECDENATDTKQSSCVFETTPAYGIVSFTASISECCAMLNRLRDAWAAYRSVAIIYRIAVAFVLGSVCGLAVGAPAAQLEPLGTLFVRLLKMIIIPVVVFTLLMGARQLSPTRIGKIGGEVIALYLGTTAVAIAIGLLAGNLINPGVGLEVADAAVETTQAPDLGTVLMNVVPTNPIGAMANGDVLPTIFFTIALGISFAILQDEFEPGTPVHDGAQAVFKIAEAGSEAMFNVVWGVMEYGVIGVFALMATTFGEAGVDAILPFAKLIGALALAVVLHIGVTYLFVIQWGLLRESPRAFLAGAKEAMVTALSIRSSSGTLPVTMNNADENFGIDEEVYSFSLPLGATINMDGTAMYQGVAAIFAANLVGQTLTLAEQATVIVTALLASVGTAGVPGSGLIMLTLVLTQLGLPLEVVGMVAGVDPILDRLRTMNNVTGDLAVTTLVADWNDRIDRENTVWERTDD
ncbi:proton/sodium-glutamate symport protein (plasmid) [Halobacterium salinarum NRC-1]|uniref:Proton/sodium-glutamate symport protein n=7 Tax=Halobacterium salinarum TaxID=2242 RepID=Q9HHN5_HALSA|nr:proton/sodium-glutamate symport protein [Halobacterium salinarum NRC-1]MCF2206749.1 dicarboxylate/amino acid:cation symporter [Halobacterium salinarum]MCF2240097.1 dicarboxylate/amino acid:cation symporter [Halobacterium salinarum]